MSRIEYIVRDVVPNAGVGQPRSGRQVHVRGCPTAPGAGWSTRGGETRARWSLREAWGPRRDSVGHASRAWVRSERGFKAGPVSGKRVAESTCGSNSIGQHLRPHPAGYDKEISSITSLRVAMALQALAPQVLSGPTARLQTDPTVD